MTLAGAPALIRNVVAVLASAVVFSGCSGVRPYPNTLEKNLVIRTATESGSMFAKVAAEVDIFSVTAGCETEYRGTVDLDRPSVAIGLPPGRLSYMVFVFSRSSLFGSSRSAISHETLLEARAGYSYDVRVSYRDDIYNVAIHEEGPQDSGGRKIALRDIRTCQTL